MHFTVCLEAGEGFNLYGMQGTEDIVFDIRVFLFQFTDQVLCLETLGIGKSVFGLLGEAAGAVDEMKIIMGAPVQNGFFLDTVHRPDQFHFGEVLTMGLRYDCLQLGGVEHCHKSSFNRVIQMMTQGNLVTAQLLRQIEELLAAMPGAEETGRLLFEVRIES